MDIKLSDVAEWGSFALVAYIPEPLGAFLQSMRHDLPGQENPQAHITVLPPRPLKAPAGKRLARGASSRWGDLNRFLWNCSA